MKAFGGGQGDSGVLEMRTSTLALNAKYSQRMAALSGHGAPRRDTHSRPAPTRSRESPPRPVPKRRSTPAARPQDRGLPLGHGTAGSCFLGLPPLSPFPLCISLHLSPLLPRHLQLLSLPLSMEHTPLPLSMEHTPLCFQDAELCSQSLEDRVARVVPFFLIFSGSFKCKRVKSNRLRCNSS